MANRPTINDLARFAGVSVATVDRVLNGRARVRAETAARVFEAAQRIGYHGAALIGQRLHAERPVFRLGIVLNRERQAFYQGFREVAEATVRNTPDVRGQALVRFAPTQSPSDIARTMESLSGDVDAIAATAPTHVEVTDAVERLQAAGIPCFALLNDFAQGARRSYIGLNNIKAGRVAAHQIAATMHRGGKIAVIVGGSRWHGHALRETGFRSYFREYAPQFPLLDTLVNLETRQLSYEASLDLLGRHPDLRGIYCAGGGMEGAIAAVREVRAPGEVQLVVHELTPESRKGLSDRFVTMVLATPLERLCADLVRLALQARGDDATALPGQHFLQPEIFLPESL